MKIYFKIAAYFVFVAVVMGIRVSTIFALSSGPADGRTGSPADGLKTCKDTGCHNSFTLNSGPATFSISAADNYTLGEVVPVTISFSDSKTAKHGFELSALDASDEHVGTFSSVDNKTKTTDGKGYYIKHTSTGDNQSGNASFNVTWTAPTSEVKNPPVTFYAAGNEADGNFSPTGDYIYTTTKQISTVAGTSTTTPTATPIATTTPTTTPVATTTPTATPVATPTTSACEPEDITLDTKKKLNLKLGEIKEVTVTVSGADDCESEGATVTVAIKTGKNRVSINATTATTDTNGQATFIITAGQKKGNSRVEFTVKDSEGGVSTASVTVKIRKK